MTPYRAARRCHRPSRNTLSPLVGRQPAEARAPNVLPSIRQAEVGAAKTMIERTEERFGLKPERLAADTAYGRLRC